MQTQQLALTITHGHKHTICCRPRAVMLLAAAQPITPAPPSHASPTNDAPTDPSNNSNTWLKRPHYNNNSSKHTHAVGGACVGVTRLLVVLQITLQSCREGGLQLMGCVQSMGAVGCKAGERGWNMR